MVPKFPFPEEGKNLMTLLIFCRSPLHRGMHFFCIEKQKKENYRSCSAWCGLEFWLKNIRLTTEL